MQEKEKSLRNSQEHLWRMERITIRKSYRKPDVRRLAKTYHGSMRRLGKRRAWSLEIRNDLLLERTLMHAVNLLVKIISSEGCRSTRRQGKELKFVEIEKTYGSRS